jgi:hypothetical protein
LSFQITFNAARHAYEIDGVSVPSVTQILGVIDKSGPMAWWGQGIGVKGVCELRRRLGDEMPWDDPDGIVKLLTPHKLTTNHVGREARTRGTSIHQALADYMQGKPLDAGDFPEEDRFYVVAAARSLIELRPEPLEFEQVVGSLQYGYAGTFDLLADVDGVTTRIDYKTGKRLYPEVQLQLAAYEWAAVESGHPASERQLAVCLKPDGGFEAAECRASLDDFLMIKNAWHTVRRISTIDGWAKAA